MSESQPREQPETPAAPAPTPTGKLELSAADLAAMGAVWIPGAARTETPPPPTEPPPPWQVVSSLDELSWPDDARAEEPLAVDELGLEVAYGVEAAPPPEQEPTPGDDTVVPLRPDVTAPVPAPAQARRPAPVRPVPWYERFFDADYLELEPQPSVACTQREVEFALASFGLARGARILDLCCGVGRHALELAVRGYEVVGLDLSRVMLDRAAQEARNRKLAVDFVHADARKLSFRRLFDGVLLWGSSFGYFRDSENPPLLKKIAEALRPSGRLLLQVVNRDFYLRELPRCHWRRVGDALILDEMELDSRSSRFRLRRSVLRGDGRERLDTLDFRAYGLHELLDLLTSQGFTPLEVSGRITSRGVFLGVESPSIIVLAQVR